MRLTAPDHALVSHIDRAGRDSAFAPASYIKRALYARDFL
jgi:hypothetical protein